MPMQPKERGALRKNQVNRYLTCKVAALGDHHQFCGIGRWVDLFAQAQVGDWRRFCRRLCDYRRYKKDYARRQPSLFSFHVIQNLWPIRVRLLPRLAGEIRSYQKGFDL